MKRPLAIIGLTAMTVLAVCFYASQEITVVLLLTGAIGLLISFIVPMLRKHKAFAGFFASVLIAVVMFTSFVNLYIAPIQQKYVSESGVVSGTLCEEVFYERGLYYYEIKADRINDEKANVKILLSVPEYFECKVGDRVDFTSEIRAVDSGRHIGDRIYLASSIYYSDSPVVTKAEVRPVYYYATELRSKLRSNLYMELDYDNASLASAMLLGDNSGFEDEVYNNLRAAGLTHIVVVSGLHLSIITLIFNKITKRVINNRYIKAVFMAIVVIFFLALTGFGKSSIRAAIMLFVIIAAELFGRESDSVNSLGFAAILLCIANPCVVGDMGVLLSFSSTFGIVVYADKLDCLLTCRLSQTHKSRYPWLNKAARYISAAFSCSLTASLATIPVAAFSFSRVSLVQLFANLCVFPVIRFFMLAALMAAVLHFVPFIDIITDVFAFVADWLGWYILKAAELFASFPFASVRADYGFVFVWVLVSVLLLACAVIFRRKVKHINLICLILCIVVLFAGSTTNILINRDTVTLHLVTGDKGYGVLISTGYGNISLISSGDYYVSGKINDLLEVTYSERQLMVVASYNNTASKCAADILREFDYNKILMYDTDDNSQYARRLSASRGELENVYGDTRINLWDKAELYIVERKGAVYIRLSFGGSSVLMLPHKGDASDIPEDIRNCDVLVASEAIDNMHLLSSSALYYCNDSNDSSETVGALISGDADVFVVEATDKFNITG